MAIKKVMQDVFSDAIGGGGIFAMVHGILSDIDIIVKILCSLGGLALVIVSIIYKWALYKELKNKKKMAHLTITNVLLLFLGLLLNLLYALQKAKKESKIFSAGFYIKDNWIQVCITIVSAFASLIMADDLLKLFQVSAEVDSPFYTVHAFVSGIIPVFIVEKIMKIYKK